MESIFRPIGDLTWIWNFSSVQFSSVAQLCPTLCDPMNCSRPDLPVHHQVPESNQTHAHRAGDAIQPSHPLSSPSPPTPNPSKHQGLFQWVNSSHEVAKVLEFQLRHQSFQWTPRTDNPLEWTGWISLQSKRLSSYSPTKGRWNVTLWAPHVWQAGAEARATDTLSISAERNYSLVSNAWWGIPWWFNG